jgi:diacylglycerol kinase (ATP)
VGGDGTIYEVVNGLDLKRQYLGIIPTGTGNGLARDLHVLDISSALRSLETPRLVPLDLIKVRYHVGQSWHERYIIHTSGVGYIAEVVALGIGPLKWLRYLRYAAAACVQCCRQQAFVARMRIDDQPTRDCLLTNLVVNNTRYAGPFCLFPSASVQDGRLDLLFGRIPPFSQLLEDLGILTQTYFLEWSQRARGQTVELELSKSAPLMLDGEVIANVDAVRFQLDRGCLNCVTGSASHQTARRLA